MADSALPAHRAHGDIVPAPAGGCPTDAPTATKRSTDSTGSADGSPGSSGNSRSSSGPGRDANGRLEILGRDRSSGGVRDLAEVSPEDRWRLRHRAGADRTLPVSGFDALLYGLLGVGLSLMGAGLRLTTANARL